jgi:hypothetical protein
MKSYGKKYWQSRRKPFGHNPFPYQKKKAEPICSILAFGDASRWLVE